MYQMANAITTAPLNMETFNLQQLLQYGAFVAAPTLVKSYNGPSPNNALNYMDVGGVGLSVTPFGIPTGGTVTSLRIVANGTETLNITGINGSYVTFFNLVASNNRTGLWDYLFGGNDQITGSVGDDFIIGGRGADQLIGGAGEDTLSYATSLDGISVNFATKSASGGDASGDVIDQFENVIGSAFADALTGRAGEASKLFGGEGNDVIRGGVAGDTLDGGTGNDTINYAASAFGVKVDLSTNFATGGDATGDVISNFESIVGSAFADELTSAGSSDSQLHGGTGNDILTAVYGFNTQLYGEEGNDTLIGGQPFSYLYGGEGDDILIGADGETLDGGNGNDTYYIQVNPRNPIILENTNTLAGIDRIYSAEDFSLEDRARGVEQLFLTGTSTSGVGRDLLDDLLVGNSEMNVLTGLGGSDLLFGGGGTDTLSGGNGADNLWGGAGSDVHFGGDDAAIDYARYDDANWGNLTIRLDFANLNTSIAAGDTYVGIEGLVAGSGNDILVGNNASNYLLGVGGNDQIYGQGGSDYLYGGDGTNQLWGGSGSDSHTGGAGIDYARYDDTNWGNLILRLDAAMQNTGVAAGDIYNSIEGLVGGLGNDLVVGDQNANYLFGGGGVDSLFGSLGNDYLNGGAGADKFAFNSALNASTNVDYIADFTHAVDDILLTQSIFSAIGASLDASELAFGTSAADANDYLIYNNANGYLYYDANGNGAGGQTLFARVTAGTVLDIGDFMIS
jgi:Ca2+-binding RTX toxin-like protein